MKHRIFLLRHGHAVPEAPGLRDFERPLSPRGVEEVGRVAGMVAPACAGPGNWVVSPAARTQQTGAIFMEAMDAPHSLAAWDRGYLADAWTWLEWLSSQPEEWGWLGVIGHNPGLSELAAYLVGEAPEIPTSGWVEIDLGELPWAQLNRRCGKIRSFLTPKSLWLPS